MPKSVPVFYSIVRYYFNELRDEAINVGILAVSSTERSAGYRFLDDFRYKARRDVRLNLGALRSFEAEVTSKFNKFNEEKSPVLLWGYKDELSDRKFLNFLSDYLGGNIRVSPPRFIEAEDLEEALQDEFSFWVETKPPVRFSTKPVKYVGPRREAVSKIGKILRDASLNVKRKFALTIDGLEEDLYFDYAYQTGDNEPFRLVNHALLFNDKDLNEQEAYKALGMWDMANRHTKEKEQLREWTLTVVFYPKDESVPEHIPEIARISLNGGKVSTYTLSDFESWMRTERRQQELPLP